MTQVQAPPPPDLQSDWPTQAVAGPPERPSRLAFLREFPALITLAFAIAILLKTFLVQAFFIPSASMVPTLVEDDRVIVNKLAYRFREPRRGEIIVFVAERFDIQRSLPEKVLDFLTEGLGVSPPCCERDFIKRVIGLPGETIEVTDEGVFITPPEGERFKLQEPYIFDQEAQGSGLEPFVVPEDHYFVMGDNRANSSDSRTSLGPIARDDIIGKAFVLIYPGDESPSRLGTFDTPIYEPAGDAADADAQAAGLVALPLAAFGTAALLRTRRRLR